MADLSLYKLNKRTQCIDKSYYEEISGNWGGSNKYTFNVNLRTTDLDSNDKYIKGTIGFDHNSQSEITVPCYGLIATASEIINNTVTITLTATEDIPTSSFFVCLNIEAILSTAEADNSQLVSTFPMSDSEITVNGQTLKGNVTLQGSGGTNITANGNTITVHSETQGTAETASIAYKLGENAYQIALERDIKIIGKQLHQVYDEVLKK